MVFLPDVPKSEWGDPHNYSKWDNLELLTVGSVQLKPLVAKAFHVIGTLVEIFNAAGHLLYCNPNEHRPLPHYYRYAYLLACSAIELLGRCQEGISSVRASTLEFGLSIVDLEEVTVNIRENGKPAGYTYDVTKLVALRNLIAHGQGIATKRGHSVDVMLHVELLNHFPAKLSEAFDKYYHALFISPDPSLCKQLARAAVEPTLYSKHSGQIFRSAIEEAYNKIYKTNKKPSEVLCYKDWEVYNPKRDGG